MKVPDNRKIIIEIFLAGLEHIRPLNLIRQQVLINGNTLSINGVKCDLLAVKNIYVIGAGKASMAMASAIEEILGPKITGGLVITKYGHSMPLKYIQAREAGHPIPDKNGVQATQELLELTSNLGKEDLVICLISGGGSALLTDIPDGCNLKDLIDLNEILIRRGLSIDEINCIRRHISEVKGGQLAKKIYPSKLISLIISDVNGDSVENIASGPTAPDPTTYGQVLKLLGKYSIWEQIPKSIAAIIQDGLDHGRQETLKEWEFEMMDVQNHIIGTNHLALEMAKEKAEEYGFKAMIVESNIHGDVQKVSQLIVSHIKELIDKDKTNTYCLIFGGEPTVHVKGNGVGGRNQHLALVTAQALNGMEGVTMLSAGTDGTDGPTDAAGAVVDVQTLSRADELGIDMNCYILNNDSNSFFTKVGGLVVTGPTQTNVMDMMIVLYVPIKLYDGI